jgi:hypothetical protein
VVAITLPSVSHEALFSNVENLLAILPCIVATSRRPRPIAHYWHLRPGIGGGICELVRALFGYQLQV